MSGAPRLRGSLLTTPTPAPGPTPARLRLTDTALVRATLRQSPAQWFSSADLAAAIGLTVAGVNGVIYTLIKRGYVERERDDRPHRRGQRYRWGSRP